MQIHFQVCMAAAHLHGFTQKCKESARRSEIFRGGLRRTWLENVLNLIQNIERLLQVLQPQLRSLSAVSLLQGSSCVRSRKAKQATVRKE